VVLTDQSTHQSTDQSVGHIALLSTYAYDHVWEHAKNTKQADDNHHSGGGGGDVNREAGDEHEKAASLMQSLIEYMGFNDEVMIEEVKRLWSI